MLAQKREMIGQHHPNSQNNYILTIRTLYIFIVFCMGGSKDFAVLYGNTAVLYESHSTAVLATA